MIKRSNLFWGAVLIFLGALFMVDTLGIMRINLWRIFFPLLLILFGVWILLGYFLRDQSVENEVAEIPLDGIRSARINFHHAAGKLSVASGTNPMSLFSGTFGGGLKIKSSSENGINNFVLHSRDGGFPIVAFPWLWGPQNYLHWDVRLTEEIPLDLRFNTGASDTRLDLTDLKVTNLRVDTGASATEINLPDSLPYSKVLIKAGAASIKINVPEFVAARIRVSGGLMGASVDRIRFPKSGGYYQSPNYENSSHQIEIRVEIGAGSVTIQ
jgi:hypothetical protein